MAATAAMIAKVREMTNEVAPTTYRDAQITTIIERHPIIDERGVEPYEWDTSTVPPTQDDSDSWLPTYDLNAAAADVWDQKAAAAAADYDYSADGANLRRSQVYEQYRRQAAYYRSRRAPRTITQRPEPPPPTDYSVANRID